MITKETMSHSLRRMFTKESDVPIQIVQDPYFLYMIDLLDEYAGGLRTKLDVFLDCVNKCGGEKGFCEESFSIRDGVIAHIMLKPAYQEFITCDMSKYKNDGEKANLYTINNDGNDFISVDFVKANFSILRGFSEKLVDGKETYEDFISVFTEHEHFRKSRQIRQYIFGNLSPKRQTSISRYFIGNVAKEFLKVFLDESIVAFSHDEVVITAKSSKTTKEAVERVYSSNITSMKVRVEKFKLHRIGDHPFYMKQFDDGKFQLKCVPEYFLPQVYKYVTKQVINDLDLSFFFEGKIAKFMEPLEF